jgi:hypothetical protein
MSRVSGVMGHEARALRRGMPTGYMEARGPVPTREAVTGRVMAGMRPPIADCRPRTAICRAGMTHGPWLASHGPWAVGRGPCPPAGGRQRGAAGSTKRHIPAHHISSLHGASRHAISQHITAQRGTNVGGSGGSGSGSPGNWAGLPMPHGPWHVQGDPRSACS